MGRLEWADTGLTAGKGGREGSESGKSRRLQCSSAQTSSQLMGRSTEKIPGKKPPARERSGWALTAWLGPGIVWDRPRGSVACSPRGSWRLSATYVPVNKFSLGGHLGNLIYGILWNIDKVNMKKITCAIVLQMWFQHIWFKQRWDRYKLFLTNSWREV